MRIEAVSVSVINQEERKMLVTEVKNAQGEIIKQRFFNSIEAALTYMELNKLSGTIRPLNQDAFHKDCIHVISPK